MTSLIQKHIHIILYVMIPSIAKRLLAGLMLTLFAVTASAAAELIMVEERGCVWCARWNAEIAPIYPKTAESRVAPLRRIDISKRKPEGFEYARPVVFTPTFVLVSEGNELGRIEGYPGEDLFWMMLAKLLKDHGFDVGQ